MKQGDIVLIRFPFTDLTATKVRPAMVISSEAFNKGQQDAIFLLITSNILRVTSYDYLVEEAHPEFARTGLKKASVFRIGRIHALNQKLAYSRLGAIGTKLRAEVLKRLSGILTLS
jgi:mRNA interferase MazF